MPFLTYFDPASTDPRDLVDREADVRWLKNSLMSFFRGSDKSRGRAVALLGDRGVGKSIVMKKVISDLREVLSATTLFVEVDCRRVRSQRRVYHEIARQILNELGGRADISPAMIDNARVLEAITEMGEAKRSVVVERITAYKSALDLKPSRQLLSLLNITYGIHIEQSSKRQESHEGVVHFDDARVRDLVIAFFEDLRANQGLDAIVVLDNLDELNHESFIDDELRKAHMAEIDALIGLALAPIGFALTVRTYFASSLTREIDGNRVLERLSDDEHVEIVRRRIQREPAEIQAAFGDSESSECIANLAKKAPTSLALLSWFNFLAQNDLHRTQDVQKSLLGLAKAKYAAVNIKVIERIAAAFAAVDGPLSDEQLLAACEGRRLLMTQLLRSQIVLPVDFWHPVEFLLSPELHFMLGR